MASHPSRASP